MPSSRRWPQVERGERSVHRARRHLHHAHRRHAQLPILNLLDPQDLRIASALRSLEEGAGQMTMAQHTLVASAARTGSDLLKAHLADNDGSSFESPARACRVLATAITPPTLASSRCAGSGAGNAAEDVTEPSLVAAGRGGAVSSRGSASQRVRSPHFLRVPAQVVLCTPGGLKTIASSSSSCSARSRPPPSGFSVSSSKNFSTRRWRRQRRRNRQLQREQVARADTCGAVGLHSVEQQFATLRGVVGL
eukprot:7382945-Prymnesium_polylepis.1